MPNHCSITLLGTLCHKLQKPLRDSALKIIGSRSEEPLPSLTDAGIEKINELAKSIKAQCEKLGTENPTEQIKELKRQLIGLQHREILSKQLPQIKDYVQIRVWAKKASKVGGNTAHITLKYNELFKGLVKDRYIELFQKTLKDLQRPLRVKIDTVGVKGKTFKQIVLETATTIEGATPDKVLSEGEKRAVAIADFLTEVALDSNSSGIILDDPVTSLDLEWRETIAHILVDEAKRRQVIVFTHDLPFLYYLKKYAEENAVDIAAHWIKRGEIDDKPGYVWCNNSPALEKDFRNATQARELYKRAKSAPPEEQERLLRDGFGALRTAYEAFTIYDLFNQVVMRFEERISFLRLKDIKWNQSVADEVVIKCEHLSRYITGHLHSDILGALKPTSDALLKEIQDFDSIKKKLKEPKP